MYNNITSLKNATEPSEIGGLAYFLVYISEYLPYVILIGLGEIVGILGNNNSNNNNIQSLSYNEF